jgi:hypothetical protein
MRTALSTGARQSSIACWHWGECTTCYLTEPPATVPRQASDKDRLRPSDFVAGVRTLRGELEQKELYL